jgi:hypothetical protein
VLAFLVMLVSWEILKKKNVRVFRNNPTTATMLTDKIE